MSTPPQEDRLVRKSDLDDAKADLRREMKLYLGVGSAIGTTISGVFGALLPRQTAATVEAVFGLLPF